MKYLGMRIKELRSRKGVSQLDLAKYLKVGKSTVSNYETSYSMPDNNTLSKIADYFGVTTDYLLGRDDQVETIAAHFKGEEYTEEELEEIENFKKYVLSKRNNK